jgi:TatD DNase family protein
VFIDSHCHLDFPDFAGRTEQILARMRENSVDAALCISVTLDEFPAVLQLAEAHDNLWASVGVHPDYPDCVEPQPGQLVTLAQHPKVVAIGETGLDYYRLQGDLEWQRERFRVHIRAAIAANKPLIVHTRSASADTIRLLREEGADKVGGVLHCFTEDWDTAKAAIELGFAISFSGIVTFKSAQSLRDVALRVPDENLLIETDAPYLAPVPHRGKTNEPAFVRHVAECLAALRGVSSDHIGQVTTSNFSRIFKVLGFSSNVNSQ